MLAAMLDVEFARSQFPALSSGFVYLDNAGGSQTLRTVAERAADYLLHTNVQLGASYRVSVLATERVMAASRAAARYVNADDPKEVVLGSSTTQLVSNIALAMQAQLAPGDEVVVTTADHEANVGAWRRLEGRGVVVKTWRVDPESYLLEERDLLPLLGAKTKLVAMAHVSNVLGGIHDVARFARVAHEHGARLFVDGVAYAPHREVDVRAWDVDYYVFSLYKVYGPHVALLYGKRELLEGLSTINHGFVTDVPYKLQPGNVNYELAHATTAIWEYVDALGGKAQAFADIAAHEEALCARLLEWMKARPGVRIVGDTSAKAARRVPTVAFTVLGHTPESIVEKVDRHDVGIRHGDFYAKGLARQLGIDRTGGVVRVSMVHYNTTGEVDALIAALDRAIG